MIKSRSVLQLNGSCYLSFYIFKTGELENNVIKLKV